MEHAPDRVPTDTPPVPASPELPAEIIAYYTRTPETERLTTNAGGELEFVRTMEILSRHLPPAPAVVLDVGGGAGVYAVPLARLGYAVHLLDLTPVHTRQARAVSLGQPDHPLAGVTLGDARALPWRDHCADAVLLLGPLYHLTERQDRLQALTEARRVLRPGGIVLAVGVSRFASLLDGLRNDRLLDEDFLAIVERDLRDGQHRNPTTKDHYWTAAFLHHPDHLRAEVAEAGFTVVEMVAVEGPEFAVRNLPHWWNDPVRRDLLLGAIRSVEREPSMLGISSHILVAGRKD